MSRKSIVQKSKSHLNTDQNVVNRMAEMLIPLAILLVAGVPCLLISVTRFFEIHLELFELGLSSAQTDRQTNSPTDWQIKNNSDSERCQTYNALFEAFSFHKVLDWLHEFNWRIGNLTFILQRAQNVATEVTIKHPNMLKSQDLKYAAVRILFAAEWLNMSDRQHYGVNVHRNTENCFLKVCTVITDRPIICIRKK